MRHSTLDMRSLLLDIELTPNNRPPSSTTVIRMHIQAGDGLRRSQRHRQLQLCVPLVGVVEPTYHGSDDAHDLLDWHPGGVTAGEEARRSLTVDVVHRDPQLAVVLAAVVHADDMRMPSVEARSASRLNRVRYSG